MSKVDAVFARIEREREALTPKVAPLTIIPVEKPRRVPEAQRYPYVRPGQERPLRWHKLKTEDGRAVMCDGAFFEPGMSGVFIATREIDTQTTHEYIVADGVVHGPIVCHNGHARHLATEKAKNLHLARRRTR